MNIAFMQLCWELLKAIYTTWNVLRWLKKSYNQSSIFIKNWKSNIYLFLVKKKYHQKELQFVTFIKDFSGRKYSVYLTPFLRDREYIDSPSAIHNGVSKVKHWYLAVRCEESSKRNFFWVGRDSFDLSQIFIHKPTPSADSLDATEILNINNEQIRKFDEIAEDYASPTFDSFQIRRR